MRTYLDKCRANDLSGPKDAKGNKSKRHIMAMVQAAEKLNVDAVRVRLMRLYESVEEYAPHLRTLALPQLRAETVEMRDAAKDAETGKRKAEREAERSDERAEASEEKLKQLETQTKAVQESAIKSRVKEVIEKAKAKWRDKAAEVRASE